MNFRGQFAIVLVGVFLISAGNSFGQEETDPFSTSKAETSSSTVSKKTKLVVHTETLDQCIDWMQTSYSIARMKAEINQLRHRISSDADPDQKEQAEKTISHLQSRISSARKELNRILVSTTIDYQRYQQFKHELAQFESNWYENLTMSSHIARTELRELRTENERLRQKIRDLESRK